MPATDRNHQAVIRSLSKSGWSVIKEHYSLAVGETADDLRRLYIDLAVQSQEDQIVLIEIKLIDQSPVHQFMMLVGQYLVYRSALDYLGQDTPLYVALSSVDYTTMVKHPLGQQVMNETLRRPIPMVIYDATQEEILRWIPEL
ncbi:MAG: element excision factor XisH family protein [Phototrophicaceae bacterium]